MSRLTQAALALSLSLGALVGAPAPAHALLTGECKEVELQFKNETGSKVDVPRAGHRMRNKGSLESWNKLELGASKSGLADGSSWSSVNDLSIKCVSDAEFEIKWSDARGDHTKIYTSVDITDKKAVFTLK